MSIATTAVLVTTSATAVAALCSTREELIFAVPSGGSTVYVGGADVTSATGIPVEGGRAMAVAADLIVGNGPGRKLQPSSAVCSGWYGVVATGTQDVRVLEVMS